MKQYKIVRAVNHSRLELDINNYASKGWIVKSMTVSNEGENEMFYAVLEKDV